ncbi:MAG: hypothetical protein QOG89_138, partial [Thermomicrobiales bacterium]|nr:hypothetical protein [Thermomicrobiales bacterium]
LDDMAPGASVGSDSGGRDERSPSVEGPSPRAAGGAAARVAVVPDGGPNGSAAMADWWPASNGCSAAARLSQSGKSKPSPRLMVEPTGSAVACRSAKTAESILREPARTWAAGRVAAATAAAPQSEQKLAPSTVGAPHEWQGAPLRSRTSCRPQMRHVAAFAALAPPQSWQKYTSVGLPIATLVSSRIIQSGSRAISPVRSRRLSDGRLGRVRCVAGVSGRGRV